MQKWPDAGEVFISNSLAGIAELVNDFLHANSVPHHDGIAQQAQATGLVHDFVEIAISKLAPIGKKQPGRSAGAALANRSTTTSGGATRFLRDTLTRTICSIALQSDHEGRLHRTSNRIRRNAGSGRA